MKQYIHIIVYYFNMSHYMLWMFVFPKGKESLEKRIQLYLKQSYYTGYELNNYFTKEQQIKMFEQLLKGDSHFKQQWYKGTYVTPNVQNETMYLSPYIQKKVFPNK